LSQNYTTGQVVLYQDTIGTRPYTCVVNTVSNEVPTNPSYWKLGYELNVTSSVIQYTCIGFYLKLDNFVTNDLLGQIINIDAVHNKVYVEINPTHSYLFTSPTYIRQTVYFIKNYQLSEPALHDVGARKIGGAYIPADVKITADYANNSASDSTIVGRVEFLY